MVNQNENSGAASVTPATSIYGSYLSMQIFLRFFGLHCI
jgi:hypothetical protein